MKTKPTTETELIEILLTNNNIKTILDRTTSLGIQNWYLGAGALSQTYWNYLHGFESDQHIKDYDLVYFDDSDTTYEGEDVYIQNANTLFSDLPIEVEVRNQARVNLWYEQKFDTPMKYPYTSCEDGIRSWPTTATTVAITNENGNYRIYAPFGLEDFLNGIIRPNKTMANAKSAEVYAEKSARWKNIWSELVVIPWTE